MRRQHGGNMATERLSEEHRNSIPNLTPLGCLASLKYPFVRERLDSGCFSHRQLTGKSRVNRWMETCEVVTLRSIPSPSTDGV